MKGIINKIILLCLWSSFLISINYIESLSEVYYEGPYSVWVNHVGFTYDENSHDDLYDELNEIDSSKTIMTFDDDTLFLKCDRRAFNHIQVT